MGKTSQRRCDITENVFEISFTESRCLYICTQKDWLKQLQANAEQVCGKKEGRIWTMNPTETTVPRLNEYQSQLKVVRKRENVCGYSWDIHSL